MFNLLISIRDNMVPILYQKRNWFTTKCFVSRPFVIRDGWVVKYNTNSVRISEHCEHMRLRFTLTHLELWIDMRDYTSSEY